MTKPSSQNRSPATLPEGFVRLDLAGDRGLPQSTTFAAGGTSYTISLGVATADLASLLAADRRTVLIDPASRFETPATAGPAGAYFHAPPDALGDQALRPQVIVREQSRVVAALPARVGHRLAVARAGAHVMDLWFASLSIRAGNLVGSATLGSSIVAGALDRTRPQPGTRPTRTPLWTPESEVAPWERA